MGFAHIGGSVTGDKLRLAFQRIRGGIALEQRRTRIMVTCAKEKVEKVYEVCGGPFKTARPARARFCGSKCRSKAWNESHRVTDPQEIIRAYWRESRRRRIERKTQEFSRPT